MSKAFHIEIKDNRTGETCISTDTDCIVGAVHMIKDGENGTQVIGYSNCNSETLVNTAYGAIRVSKQMTDKPVLRMALGMMLMHEGKEDEDEVDSTRENGCTEIPFPTSRKDSKS